MEQCITRSCLSKSILRTESKVFHAECTCHSWKSRCYCNTLTFIIPIRKHEDSITQENHISQPRMPSPCWRVLKLICYDTSSLRGSQLWMPPYIAWSARYSIKKFQRVADAAVVLPFRLWPACMCFCLNDWCAQEANIAHKENQHHPWRTVWHMYIIQQRHGLALRILGQQTRRNASRKMCRTWGICLECMVNLAPFVFLPGRIHFSCGRMPKGQRWRQQWKGMRGQEDPPRRRLGG